MKRNVVAIGVFCSIVFVASGLQAAGWLATAKDVNFVAKVNVSNLAASSEWYAKKLGLVHDPKFDTPNWQQLNLPGRKGVAIGLNLDAAKVGTGGATATFVVKDIEKEQKALIKKGVNVGVVMPVGEGVCLAFFADPDGNELGLRQNGCKIPKAGH
jgi:predicted enzyme related to lactoylglutathione lyase